ncbi:uncharacterized protein [Leptinotarsa decemlineata]|uniref:uncharacterized protein n=1 Tax=Leptinotarsa decemlineata TaxID=7539 RepID=UPI003D30CCD2
MERDFYEKLDGVAMGSPPSSVIANFFMEQFEKKAIDAFDFKPTIWLRYVDDPFVIFRLGRDRLNLFLDHVNAQYPSIKFTMETEQEQRIAFLDVRVERRGTRLTHKLYRKPAHTDRYLHALLNPHSSQKRGIINTLTERARRICNTNKKDWVIFKWLQDRMYNYSVTEINKVMKLKISTSQNIGNAQKDLESLTQRW